MKTNRDKALHSYVEYLDTQIGPLEIMANAKGITAIVFVEQMQAERANRLTQAAKHQLKEYMAGQRQLFDLPLTPHGTAFQCKVWQQLRLIQYGETCSYSEVAHRLGQPKAVRAVGAANGKNPISIVVPCHRVIGRSGKLTGYAGGLARKAWLLALENKTNRFQQMTIGLEE